MCEPARAVVSAYLGGVHEHILVHTAVRCGGAAPNSCSSGKRVLGTESQLPTRHVIAARGVLLRLVSPIQHRARDVLRKTPRILNEQQRLKYNSESGTCILSLMYSV